MSNQFDVLVKMAFHYLENLMANVLFVLAGVSLKS